MKEDQKHALRKEHKSEEVLEKDKCGINMDKSEKHIEKDLLRAKDDVDRNFGERQDKIPEDK